MHDRPTSRRERLTKLVIAVLLFLSIMIGITWPQWKNLLPIVVQSLPSYPNAQEQSLTFSFKQLHVCASDGEANEVVVRIIRFVTSDPPDVVGQFYHAVLVDQGVYTDHATTFAGAYQATFEQTIHQATSLLETTQGVGIDLRAEPKQGQTSVLLRQYHYEKLPRACHLQPYDDPWKL
jgi:hypothetical protein